MNLTEEEKQRIDFAYLMGVFNTVGVEGTIQEINRLKEVGKKPHEIYN